MLKGDLLTILLAKESSDQQTLLLSCGMAGNLIGDGEENQRVKLDVQTRV